MTATRTWRAATIVAGALLWLLAAALLWRTTVPGDLRLPDLQPADYFAPAELREAERFERFLRIDFVLVTLASLVALAVFARRAPRLAASLGLGRVGSAVIVSMVALTILFVVDLPFAVAAAWWERRHDLAHGSWLEWLLAPWAVLLAEVTFILIFVSVLVGLAARFRRYWWLAIVPVFALIGVAFATVTLLLVPLYTSPIDDRKLARDAKALATKIGAGGTPVEVEEVSDLTSQANAYAYKLGPIKRAVLWDTMLDGRFTDGEIRVVIAHELGHVAREHVLKGLGWYIVISLPLWWLIAEVTRRTGRGLWDPGNLPYGLLVITILTLVFAPIENVISRRYETEADWIALEATRDPRSAKGLFKGFAETSLSDPEPPTWAYVMLDTHPTMLQRIAMAEAWRKRNLRGRAGPAREGSLFPLVSSTSTRHPSSRPGAPS